MSSTETNSEDRLFLVVQCRRLVIELKARCNDIQKNIAMLDISLPCTDSVFRAEAIPILEELQDCGNRTKQDYEQAAYEMGLCGLPCGCDDDKLSGIWGGASAGYQRYRSQDQMKDKSPDPRTGKDKFSADIASFLRLLVDLETSLSPPEINEILSLMDLDLDFFKSLFRGLTEATLLLPNLTSVSRTLDSCPAQLRPFIHKIFEQSWDMFDKVAISTLWMDNTSLWIRLYRIHKAKGETHLQRALGIATGARSIERIEPWLYERSDVRGVSGGFSVDEDKSIAHSDNRSNCGRTVSSLRLKAESERGSVKSGDFSVREDRSVARSDNRSNWGRTVSSLYSESESGHEPTTIPNMSASVARGDCCSEEHAYADLKTIQESLFERQCPPDYQEFSEVKITNVRSEPLEAASTGIINFLDTNDPWHLSLGTPVPFTQAHHQFQHHDHPLGLSRPYSGAAETVPFTLKKKVKDRRRVRKRYIEVRSSKNFSLGNRHQERHKKDHEKDFMNGSAVKTVPELQKLLGSHGFGEDLD
ncbi:hypothetical protein EV426DRAFT_595209 [Tirmania nivea]|nr:hypothetical protein EV426DRAFT_595209 [Tirmania nivea]